MDDLRENMKSGGTGMTIMGILILLLGIGAMMAPGLTGFSILTVLGVIVLVSGVLRIVWAFQAGSLMAFAIGGLTLLCGFVLLAHPVFASGLLTVLLTIYFITDGLVELAAGFRLRGIAGSALRSIAKS